MKINSENLAKIKKYFQQKPGAVAVYLYGSFARGEAKKSSDVDLGVVFTKKRKKEKPFSLLQLVFSDELTKILKRKIEVQDLSVCRIDFAHRVLSEGRLVYSGDEKRRIEFEEKVFRVFFDLKPSFDEYYYYLSQMAKKGEIGVRYL